MQIGELVLLAPVVYLLAAAVVVLILGVFAEKKPLGKIEHFLPAHYIAPGLAFFALPLAGLVAYLSSHYVQVPMDSLGVPGAGMLSKAAMFVSSGAALLVVDPFAALFGLLMIAGTLIVMLMSIEHFGEYQKHKGEYYALLMLATAASVLAASASDLISVYLCIEFLSLVSYGLAAYAKEDRRSAEAGLKYFIYGAACSAVMLYGMSILFGIAGGKTSFAAVGYALTNPAAAGGAVWAAVIFILVGLGFKIALVPFQFWAPDVYEGAPTPVTAFLSVVSKAAGLAVLIRFMVTVGVPAPATSLSWYWALVALCAVSMFYGNLVALVQKNIKRMLAYSSIAHVGYLMVGILTAMHSFTGTSDFTHRFTGTVMQTYGSEGAPWDLQGIVIYVLAYIGMNLGAFAVVTAVGNALNSNNIESYGGLKKLSPFYAVSLAVFLVSLAGVPPTAGFFGKLFIFGGAMRTGSAGHPELWVLAGLGVVNSVISAYYYLNVVRLMFFAENEETRPVIGSVAAKSAVVIALAITLGFIFFAKPISDLTSHSVSTPTIASR